MKNLKVCWIKKWIYIAFLLLIFSTQIYAELLDDWADESAYKPAPVLFLHGFASGSPQTWDYIAQFLSQYYQPYQSIGPFIGNGGTQYLERIHFIDNNGSVDGPGGWTDQLEYSVNNLIDSDKYGSYSDRIILIAHSMGGLAARNYIMNGGENNILKLITIDTPHAGSPLSNTPKNISKSRTIGLFLPVLGWAYSGMIDTFQSQVQTLIDVDFSGEAVKDLSVGSPFLTELANRGSPSKEGFIYGISAYKDSIFNKWFFSSYYPNSRTALLPTYAGDRIVPIDSQEGWDVCTNEGKSNPIEVWHMDKIERVDGFEHSSVLQSQYVCLKILEWLDSEPPEVEITGVKTEVDGIEQDVPLVGGVYELNKSSCIVEGLVRKECFPASSKIIVILQKEGEGEEEIINDYLLKPDDAWVPNNPKSVVAGFKTDGLKTIYFHTAGNYTIKVKVVNPVGIESNEATINLDVSGVDSIDIPVEGYLSFSYLNHDVGITNVSGYLTMGEITRYFYPYGASSTPGYSKVDYGAIIPNLNNVFVGDISLYGPSYVAIENHIQINYSFVGNGVGDFFVKSYYGPYLPNGFYFYYELKTWLDPLMSGIVPNFTGEVIIPYTIRNQAVYSVYLNWHSVNVYGDGSNISATFTFSGFLRVKAVLPTPL